MMVPNPTERFTGRVESYRRYRPGYPAEVVDLLRGACGLGEDAKIADVAAGTGLLAEIFLAAGFAVTAVEPNDEMRSACAELEQTWPKLRCVAGTAESTGLPEQSVDLITVAQAMHWFDLERTRVEFTRILKPGGWCAVLYNNRRMSGDAFHEAYERFLVEHGIDYLAVKGQHVGRKRLAQFFAPLPMRCETRLNAQALTLDGLKGRVLSSSYIPQPGDPRFAPMEAALERLFVEHAHEGAVMMIHDCVVCWGQLP
jgi:SAM-dependent methyltransferase